MTAAQPLQIIWDNTAHQGGTFSIDFRKMDKNLASGVAYIVQSGAR